jgi:cob(I)alamin adenosyltransferase
MYTRRGDAGETGLYGSKRVRKDSPRVEAYGNIDELNSCMGLAVSVCEHSELSKELKWVQGKLLVAGADLASELGGVEKANSVPRIGGDDTKRLEEIIDAMQPELPRLTNFILPGGSNLSAHLHMARSVCRRAERSIVTLSNLEKVNPELTPFFNRLSTYLFNAARLANLLEGKEDEVWRRD